jgi:hypothetical protein
MDLSGFERDQIESIDDGLALDGVSVCGHDRNSDRAENEHEQ